MLLFSIWVTLSSFNLTQAAPANDACNGKKNGDACSYQRTVTTGGRGQARGTAVQTESGFCDRTNGDSTESRNPLICRTIDSEKNGWEDCVINGDACKFAGEVGVCKPPSARTGRCDTSKKPAGNPGGSSGGGTGGSTSGGSTGGGTCQDCGGSKCNTGQVCATIGGKKECVPDAGTNNVCGVNACSTGQVCATIGGKKECISNQCTGGGGVGNGGGGTTPTDNTTPTDATAPQTVGFINPIRFNSLTELIAGIINALLGILGAITVAILVMSGFKYMTSSNPGEVGQALDGIKNAIIGLMIIMGAFLITQYVITALAG